MTGIYPPRRPVEHFLKTVDEITAKDITSIVQKIISSPLTMASYGHGIDQFSCEPDFFLKPRYPGCNIYMYLLLLAVRNVPSYEYVSSKFHA